ncbi:putative RNA-directed DNA polymerase, eukaryota, reverse transcriptase zinc-binding domain protein [Tanacetum coccineum]
MSTLYCLCCKEGFGEVKIHHIGGLWLWLQFQNEETCNAFKKNNNLKSFFSLIIPVSKNFSVDERMMWVEISRLPLCAWGSNAYKKVASTVEGDEWDKERDSESEDDIDEDQQVDKQDNKEEEKEQAKHQVESIHFHTGNEENTPPIETDNNKRSVTSDWSRPPGFKHFNKTDNEPFESSLPSKLYLNEVRYESERYGTEFRQSAANVFNAFIDDARLFEPVLGCHVKVTALPRDWLDHTPIMLHCEKVDYGPVPSRMLRKQEIISKISDIEAKIDSNIVSEVKKEDRMKFLKERDDLQQLEDMDVVQKYKVKWDVEGDENTQKFHGILNQKRHQQMVQGIMIDGIWATYPQQVKMAFHKFYKDKFDVLDSLTKLPHVVPFATLSQEDSTELENLVTLEEIRVAELLKEDVRNAVRCVFDSFAMPRGVNSSFITLIPKISNPIHIKDFRPISLIGMQYKIIAKILANRLSKVIDKLVSQEQSTFIAGRQILDGPIVLSELMSWYKKKKKLMLFKVDFEKAFDIVRSSVLLNGIPSNEFLIKHGLRQGDPLSPFLFIIVMEGLHIAMKNTVCSGLIRGAVIGTSGHKISHLFYADDVVIISDWNNQDMGNIIRVLQVCYLASGLKINVSKSNVFGLGVSSQDVEDMASDTGYDPGNIPFSYLGLPLRTNMHLTANWQPLIDRFQAKL